MHYWLDCTDCLFERDVEGDFATALEVASAHQEARGEDAVHHFVNVHRRGRE